jgi:hypothetical protein
LDGQDIGPDSEAIHHEHGSFGAAAITSGRSGDLIVCGRFNLPNDIDEGPQTGWNIPPPWVIEA